VMVLTDAPLFVGCLVHVRLIGVIRATQTERRTSIRNDRLVASIETPVNKARFRELSEVPRDTVREIEHCRFCREHCAATGPDQRVGSSHAGSRAEHARAVRCRRARPGRRA
jgi:inorganic pyrophosphatase